LGGTESFNLRRADASEEVKESVEALGTQSETMAGGQGVVLLPQQRGMAAFMGVNPILDWTYHEAWAVLCVAHAPYRKLHDQRLHVRGGHGSGVGVHVHALAAGGSSRGGVPGGGSLVSEPSLPAFLARTAAAITAIAADVEAACGDMPPSAAGGGVDLPPTATKGCRPRRGSPRPTSRSALQLPHSSHAPAHHWAGGWAAGRLERAGRVKAGQAGSSKLGRTAAGS
ncbi:hypothetical protein TSOC_013887, partial [Tetrabaena socialis]